MRFLSLFSGIEAASCAWLPVGWECVAVAEIEKFPCAVLKHHYLSIVNLGDISKITEEQVGKLGRIDLVVGGFPCQDLSVAGKRKGLKNADGTKTRSGLFFDAMRVVEWAKPRWVVIENVPGLFSSLEGRDFAAVVGELAGIQISVPGDGWGNAGVALGPRGLVEWVVLDAQRHGVPQRRRRVFLVRDSGDWSNRPPLFPISQSMCQHSQAGETARERPAPTISARTKGGGGLGTDFDCDGGVIARPLRAQSNHSNREDLQTVIPIQEIGKRQSGTPQNGVGFGKPGDPMFTLQRGAQHGIALPDVAWALQERDAKGSDSSTMRSMSHSKSHQNGGGHQAVLTNSSECDTFSGYGKTSETDTSKTLRALRIEIGEKAFSEWGLGVLASFWPTEILQSAVHGKGIRCPTIDEFGLVKYALSCQETGAERFVREMRQTERFGCSSFRWKPHEQRTIKLAAYLSKLSRPGASGEKILHDLWCASQGAGILRDALPEVQEMGRSESCEGQSVCPAEEGWRSESSATTLQSAWVWEAISRTRSVQQARHAAETRNTYAVRRLTPVCCEFLQGFPRNYTLIPGHKSDGPRYRSLGNSFCVPVVKWIAERIELVEKLVPTK